MSISHESAGTALKGTSLSLSGGGFRATLFHLGSLTRLNELGWLPKLDRIVCVSGGSILGAWLGCRWQELRFEGDVATNLSEVVGDPLRKLCSMRIDVASLWSYPLHLRGNGSRLGLLYAKHMYGTATLAELPRAPQVELMATNLLTGGYVSMSARGIHDNRIGLLPMTDLPVAMAVAASCALPPYFSPIHVKSDPADWQLEDVARKLEDPRMRKRMLLADGGAYDNLGMEAVLDVNETILFSDASSLFPAWKSLARDRTLQLMRSNTVMVSRLRSLRKRYLLEQRLGNPGHPQRGAYWGISSEIEDYGLDDALATDSEQTASLAYTRTRLSRFFEEEQAQLINWGYALTDAAMRRYLNADGPTPQWPCPEHRL
ncbi:MAG: patatin-like phospholipase family protein [Planctomycetales bacterium]|nr:patatin-like phospholipase family protein [bacterium]UNM08344.1 MAG: patatin-like phospholipase family protein [Planctomycetales bacterium]